ncbi:Ectopic P granules protein 5 like protein [Argiope bruennichi]|uniref:Ectopic P granules protein 5 like protein n=1 Tax=Argiope bruennichi TaxID=94029 RepID=A0A8T0FJ11_ARGBR|nr:Ectopic P granules protein 5 like protein [Argiope bruennichi]
MELVKEKPKTKKPKKKSESNKNAITAVEIKEVQVPKEDKLELLAENTLTNSSLTRNENELKKSEDLTDSLSVLSADISSGLEKNISHDLSQIIEEKQLKRNKFIHDSSILPAENIVTHGKNISNNAENSFEKVNESCNTLLQTVNQKEMPPSVSNGTECLYPKTAILEKEEKFLGFLKEKNKIFHDTVNVLTASDTRTEIMNVYPNLKSIQHCEKIEDIESMRTIVQTYTEEYTNKTYNEAVKRCQKFAVAVTGIENYPLFELAKEYQNARKMSNEARARLKYLNSKLNVEKANLWKLTKKETSSKGFCEDGSNVSVSKTYLVKELDESKFNEVTELLRELEEVVLSYAFYSYSDELSRMKIEQYIYNMINYLNSSNVDGYNKKDVLKKCISVLFQYQRQSTKEKSFLEECQKWLKLLVYVLLQNGDKSDYLFIVEHIIRCPNGIQAWASRLLQFPGATLCAEGSRDVLGCPCLYYVLLVLYLVLNPAPDRDFFLRNVKNKASDSTGGEFTLLDSDGEEEELFEVVRNWTNEDIISLLNQISIASLYEHILFENKGDSSVIKSPSKERIVKTFAFSTSLINILFSGLTSYCKEEFTASVECICSMIRHVVFYVTDHWEYCEKLEIPSKSALQAEYDRFIFHTIYIIFKFEKLGVWKFLATLPYKCVSKKMLWNILWIFHSPKTLEQNVYLEKDVDLKLNDDHMISTFIEKLSTFDQCGQLYLLNAYKSIAICGYPEKEFLCFIVHEVFEVTFGKNALSHLSKEGAIVLTSIMKKYPDLLTALLKEVEANADDSINHSMVMFEELDLSEWIPKCDDVRFIREWLIELPLSNPKNFLGRMLLSKMNWDFSNQGDLVLPLELHRETAVLVLEAYMKFDRKGNEWSVSNGLAQMLQFATVGNYVREEEGFVFWAWDLLFSLKLHALDKKCPMWVQIYDGFLDIDFLPDPFEELWLQPLLNGYEEKHPVACYLFLVMTNVGHNVRRLMIEGLQCLTALVKSRQYLAAIQSLYYILPFFVKNSEELLSQTEFINLMRDLIVADMSVLSNISGPVVGAVLHKIAAMIKHQISQAWALTVECATPLIKLWTSILLKVLSFQDEKNYNLKDSAKQVHFLLDVVIKISCIDSYTRNNMLDLLYSFGNPLLSTSSNSQTTIWSKFFGSNTESYTILRKQTLPDYPWLAWFILKSETRQKQTQDLWYQIQKEIARDCDITPLAALKKACNFLKIKQPALESLPIYRWALQILQSPVSHPVLPLLWQSFFCYFFERISNLDSEAPRSLGLNYFKTGLHFQILKKLKIRALETAEYYNNCVQRSQGLDVNEPEKNITSKECIFNVELCRIFRAFSFWIEDKNLHQPSLCFSALGPNYCCERLKLIFSNDQYDWFDLVSVDQLKDDLEQKVHSWVHKKKFSFSSQSSSESHEESPGERISRHLNNNKDVKSLECPENIEPPMHEIEDIALSSWNILVQLIESRQSVIFDKARSFTELSSKLKLLNSNYKNLVPQEFVNEDHWETVSKSCLRGLKCAGPATFHMLVKRYFPNQRICEKLENNRMEHRMVQDQLLNLPINELCIASVHIENYIRALSKKMETAEGEESLQFRKLGVSFIESLGNVFICNQEDQLCALAKAILKHPEAGELAFGIFNPNVASIAVFLELYEIITSAIKECSLNTIFVLLHKVDLHGILKGKGSNYCDRRKLFKLICNSLLECGSSPSKELQMVHDVLTDHFRITLLRTFPEFYEDTISFVLDGMDKNQISLNVWYEILHCFGCSTLNEKSSIQVIENALKKYAENVLLPPDQQIFVSSQPINAKEVSLTLERFYQRFMNKRNSCNIYEIYGSHVKPFGIFLAVLCHSMLSILNENVNQRETTNISQLWKSLHHSFYPWLHPAQKETSFIFSWSDEQLDDARFMFQMFTICLRNFHDKLLGYNCEKCILSYFWSSYVEIYVTPGLRHYSVALCHSECLNLPWDQFHPNSEDLEGMCFILQSSLLESKDFLAKISLKIPWIEIMKSISETMSPEYVRSTLVTLGKLLIISGLDVSLTKSNLHQNNLKALEELSWHLISIDDADGLLQLYYSTSDPINLLNEELQGNSDVYVLQFLKIVCYMVVAPNGVDYPHSNAKRLLYLHKYITALTSCISDKKDVILKNPEKLQKVLPSLFTDIEKVIVSEKPEQQMSYALPLVNEVIGFLNKITNSKLEGVVLDSLLLWLKANPRSPLLLPCLQTACRCLNQMTSAVMIVECCIATRFNTDLHNPSEVHDIWQLILTCFQIRSSMLDDFVHACVNKNAFLTLYCYLLDKIPKTSSSESKKILLLNLTDWINRVEVNENDEAKSLLLWDKVLELSVMLANEDNLQIVKTTLSAFCRKLSILGEDKSSDGFLGAVGFGRSSVLSVNYRFLCRVIVAFILVQIPLNASIRLQPMDPGLLPVAEMKGNPVISSKSMEPSPSPAALEALKNVKILLKNKPYSALRDLVNSAIEFVIDPSHALSESRILLKEYALHVFPKQYYLYALG